jgi:hypothetical protein
LKEPIKSRGWFLTRTKDRQAAIKRKSESHDEKMDHYDRSQITLAREDDAIATISILAGLHHQYVWI